VGPISLDIDIDAPRERVFDAICDLGLRPQWATEFSDDYRLERLEPRGEGAAARFRADAPGGIGFMETVISRAERPHTIVEHGRGGRGDRVAIRAVWELSGGEGSVTSVKLTFGTEPPTILHRLRELRAGGWWRRRWRRALSRLRDLLESGSELRSAMRVAGGDRQPIDSRP
jgi:uncharacterized protein YndB with AHSA1/START domain